MTVNIIIYLSIDRYTAKKTRKYIYKLFLKFPLSICLSENYHYLLLFIVFTFSINSICSK